MKKPACLLLALGCLGAKQLNAAEITLLYDRAGADVPAESMYFAANFNPESGDPASDWNGFSRYPMYDDGKHGDKEAGDGIWGVQVSINPTPMTNFEWAVDEDNNAGNGWLGTGTPFRVDADIPQVVWYFKMPEEARAGRQALEQKYGLDLSKAGPPVPLGDGEIIAFTVEAPDAEQVYLAGSFNNWANNDDGKISNPEFRMYRMDSGVWLRLLDLPHGTTRYKFVLKNQQGNFEWIGDPNVEESDGDGNSVLDLRSLMPDKYVSTVAGRELKQVKIAPLVLSDGIKFADIDLKSTWVKPDEDHYLTVTLDQDPPPDGIPLFLRHSRDLADINETPLRIDSRRKVIHLPAGGVESPIVIEALLGDPQAPSDRRVIVLPISRNASDDLRYGFYANWERVADDYTSKTDMLADLLINGIEYYDYFPAHGKYAPTEEVYEFEPFYGRKIHALDIKRKIESGHERGILSIAYVAAYAASKSIFDEYPYPMTNAAGENLIFNGRILTEKEADEKGERKWFWLMAIARDTPWFTYIQEEFERTLTDEPGDLVAFDGFEIDSYGHGEGDRYYSEGSAHSGRLLAEVIAEFIEVTWKMAHETKETAAVSFNCVNEFGMERMYDITDFLFVENWSGYKPGIEETVDICYRHRAPRNQRVVLKMYPADAGFTDPAYFPPNNLRLMMGMCITGGGSLMIAGEPNERTGEMHALNTLYYPDNVAIPEENVRIIHRYNQFDAMLYGHNHGRMVDNYDTTLYIPGSVVRAFQNDRGDITVLFLNPGEMRTWDQERVDAEPVTNREVAINVPPGMEVDRVLYLSPDKDALMIPMALDFEHTGGYVRTLVPYLDTTGAIIIKAKSE